MNLYEVRVKWVRDGGEPDPNDERFGYVRVVASDLIDAARHAHATFGADRDAVLVDAKLLVWNVAVLP